MLYEPGRPFSPRIMGVMVTKQASRKGWACSQSSAPKAKPPGMIVVLVSFLAADVGGPVKHGTASATADPLPRGQESGHAQPRTTFGTRQAGRRHDALSSGVGTAPFSLPLMLCRPARR